MDNWKINFNNYDPEEEPKQEALCVLGNGYIAVRGASEESHDDSIHYPGTYLAGGFNRMESEVAGKVIENEDFVNWPNWLVLTFKPEDGEWLNLDEFKILKYKKMLDLEKGILTRNILFRDNDGRETQLESRRLVHMSARHYAAIQWHLTPKNWSGNITVKTALDGTVINNNVDRYSNLNQNHLNPLDQGQISEDGMYLNVETWQSKIRMSQAARTNVYYDNQPATVNRETSHKKGYIEQQITFKAEQNKVITIEKIVTIFTSRDNAISEPSVEAKTAINRTEQFDQMLNSHHAAWKRIWHRSDITMNGQDEDQLVLRLHIFHLMQTASKNTVDLDVGIPSRGLHGEAYRGHILWDELFIFPFLNFRVPEITRELLNYRYRRLPEAEYMAKEASYKGAMFPWQSGSNGREESQVIHLNPQSGRWIPDDTHLQRHVNAAIAYNVWQYYQVSRDMEFLSFYGAEMFLQIARFWCSKTDYNEKRKKYEIKGVVGPDEYHTRYPGSDQPGINNNAYTNVMAIWVLDYAFKILDTLNLDRRKEILAKLNIDHEELVRWDKITKNMFIPVIEGDIIDQFEGFNRLKELDWDKYHEKYGKVLRLDRILESEDDDVNKYKANKQADVLMLFYLLSSDELNRLLKKSGYSLYKDFIPKNIAHYEKLSSHGSTLSKLVHSWVTARSNRKNSWHHFQEALMSDFKDIQGGTTPEGIHLGAMAGTVDLIQRCYLGLEIQEDALKFNPVIPEELQKICTRLRYRSHWIKVQADKEILKIISDGGWSDEITINIKDEVFTLRKGDKKEFSLQ
ncbi:MAG: glycoside hydrolase family 65 protein [Bacteroidales bacterium]